MLSKHAQRPEDRFGQKTLASTVVEMTHGKQALQAVLGQSSAFFMNEGDFSAMSLEAFER